MDGDIAFVRGSYTNVLSPTEIGALLSDPAKEVGALDPALLAKLDFGLDFSTYTGSAGASVDQIGSHDFVEFGAVAFNDTGLTIDVASATSKTITYSTPLVEGTPYTIDATFNGTERLMRLYVDKALTNVGGGNDDTVVVSSEDLKIGEGFSGCIQLPYVANRTFVDEEVAALVAEEGPLPFYDIDTVITDDMIGHWNVSNWNNGKNAGSELIDNTPNTNDLIDNGTVPFDCTGVDVWDTEGPYTP
jgi:hypothetical protein